MCRELRGQEEVEAMQDALKKGTKDVGRKDDCEK